MNRSRRSPTRGTTRTGVLLAVLLATAVAAGEPERAERVALDVAGCPEPFEASLRRILVIELGDLLDPPAPESSLSRDSIQIACDKGVLRISARSAAGEQVVRTDLSQGAFPGDAAPRAAALAALEALRAVDPVLAGRIQARRAGAEPEVTPPGAPGASAPPHEPSPEGGARRVSASPRAASEGDRLPEAPARTGPARRGATRLLAGGVARLLLGEPKGPAFGARIELSRHFDARWDAGFELEGAAARRSVGLGTVEARLLSGAAWVGPRVFGTAWSATAALGGRLGIAELSGSPVALARGHSVKRPFGGPLLLVRGDGVAGPVALALVLESGLAAVGAEGLAGGVPAISLGGGWLAGSMNAGIHF